MCGIITRVGQNDGIDELLTGLRNLEYRGYDSAGIALQNGRRVNVHKRKGQIKALENCVAERDPGGHIGIGHTRWSTHGVPSDENAHPHTDCTDTVAVVHNGIIENYNGLKSDLIERGHEFTSETDTEVIPHLLEEYREEGSSHLAAFRKTVSELSGSYAIVVLYSDSDTVYATRNGSPLVLGIDKDRYFLASDVPAFLEFTDKVIYLQDHDIARVRPGGYEITDSEGNSLERSVETVDWDSEDVGKGGYDHYMLKEIHEQPRALRQTIRGRIDSLRNKVTLEGFSPDTFDDVSQVQIVACGTSFHAALYGVHALQNDGVPANAYLANEYAENTPPIGDDTLVLGVSQSGETADTLTALRRANGAGARTLVVTNTVGSTATRECDDVIYIRAGPEIGVAASKTFTSQVVTLLLLSEMITPGVTGNVTPRIGERITSLSRLPEDIQQVLDESPAREIAEEYSEKNAYFFIGRGLGYPVALEGALKFKEISYEHAEGFAAGELKHGPLALVTQETPVFAIFDGRQTEKLLSNVKEVQSREAPVIAVARESDQRVQSVADEILPIPETIPLLGGVLANVQMQLVAYYSAKIMGRPIDKPRNLAKSVTVE